MSISAAEISTLLETQTYNPNILPQLESYLHSQVSSTSSPPNPYNFNANRTLVKLYQFFPHLAKVENLILAELLALVYGTDVQEAGVDLGALGCLIPESTKRATEAFPALLRCAELFDSCQFVEFWGAYSSLGSTCDELPKVKELLTSSAHAYTSLRRSVLNTLSLAFRSTSVENVLGQLDLKTVEELEAFVKDNTDGIVESVDKKGGVVTFVEKAENRKRDKVYQEGGRVDFAMIRGLGLVSSKE